jgi:hypothetical protein
MCVITLLPKLAAISRLMLGQKQKVPCTFELQICIYIYFVEVTLIFINDLCLFYFTVHLHSSLNIFSFPRNNSCLFVIRNVIGIIVLNENKMHIDIYRMFVNGF